MRFAYSTNAFTRTDLDTALEQIAGIGFDGVEILCDRPHWFPGEVDADEALRVAERLASLGLSVSNLNANTANGYYDAPPPENVFEPALSNADPELRQWRVGYSIAAVELAARVAAPCISVTAGRPRPGYPPERALAWFTDSLQRICEVAARKSVRVGIEYEPGLLVERASEAAEVIERVGSPELGVNLDIGHSWLDGEVPEDAIELLAGRIWNVHVEDIRARKHFHLVPGEGDLPFSRYFAALRAAGYAGFLTVELYTYLDAPVDAGRRSLAFLKAQVADAEDRER